MRREECDWTRYRTLPNGVGVDLHRSELGPREVPHWEAVEEVRRVAPAALQNAQVAGRAYVLFTHGRSTSEGWKQPTAWSVVEA